VKRREFITLLGGEVIAWPLAARAQPNAKTPRIIASSNFVGSCTGRSSGRAPLMAVLFFAASASSPLI